MAEKKLGRGLDFLLAENIKENWEELNHLEIDKIRPNKKQPRVDFDKTLIKEMADSIAENGLLQPIVVRPRDEGYEIVAGERRWHACNLLGHKKIPAIIKDVDDTQVLEFALVENIQRKDLNPIEKAEGFRRLMGECSYTQEEIGKKLGIDRSSIANFLRLLKLPEEVKRSVSRGTISMGHARALLALETERVQKEVCRRIVEERLSVREVEAMGAEKERKERPVRVKPPHIKSLEDELRGIFGTKVTLKENKKGGRIVIEFFSKEEFERLYALMQRVGG